MRVESGFWNLVEGRVRIRAMAGLQPSRDRRIGCQELDPSCKKTLKVFSPDADAILPQMPPSQKGPSSWSGVGHVLSCWPEEGTQTMGNGTDVLQEKTEVLFSEQEGLGGGHAGTQVLSRCAGLGQNQRKVMARVPGHCGREGVSMHLMCYLIYFSQVP